METPAVYGLKVVINRGDKVLKRGELVRLHHNVSDLTFRSLKKNIMFMEVTHTLYSPQHCIHVSFLFGSNIRVGSPAMENGDTIRVSKDPRDSAGPVRTDPRGSNVAFYRSFFL